MPRGRHNRHEGAPWRPQARETARAGRGAEGGSARAAREGSWGGARLHPMQRDVDGESGEHGCVGVAVVVELGEAANDDARHHAREHHLQRVE